MFNSKNRKTATMHYAVYLVVRVLICFMQALPERGCYWFSNALAWFAVDICRVRQAVVMENLRHAFPDRSALELREIERDMWRHLGLLICEIAQAGRRIHETNWRDHVRLHAPREIVATMLRDEPLVAVTAHFGNFEMCGYLAGLLGFPTYTVARPLDNPYLHEFLMKFRESTGQYMLPTRGSAPDTQRVMEAKGKLALLGDHYGGPKGCWVEYFGRPASCHKSIALLSLATKSPLIVIHTKRTDGFLRFEMELAGLHDAKSPKGSTVPELTQWYSAVIERVVSKTPGQYWWLHRRWKDHRKPRISGVPRRSRSAA